MSAPVLDTYNALEAYYRKIERQAAQEQAAAYLLQDPRSYQNVSSGAVDSSRINHSSSRGSGRNDRANHRPT
ncbi:hypothetical protein DOTSEDRAFT_48186 [Dothistroma septosporum NZE10]|uniref:Uncharacterized protein n=1 Tax=Dothistroma septosporum (strain NZE10 / CBS 128990) TaxID=675120 RepID=M2WI26_DOTSN|nr:hypothetical protein DOTSEDRAFT_48186 [Dothistroma septosporum NZE10]